MTMGAKRKIGRQKVTRAQLAKVLAKAMELNNSRMAHEIRERKLHRRVVRALRTLLAPRKPAES
jgi:hypothetical protein